ncbi:MAG: hypothetical protein WCH60_08005 [Burkholderiales bacterium]
MLKHAPQTLAHAQQRGVVLLIALIVLVAMTLGGISLVRSVSTTSAIAGNLAFQQSATLGGNVGVEAALISLNNNASLNTDNVAIGYNSGYPAGNPGALSPAAGQSWDAYWTATLQARAVAMPENVNTGNQVSYVTDRLCQSGGINCYSSPLVTTTDCGGDAEGGALTCTSSATYYRITARIAGPRGTISYVQAVYSK